MQLTPVSIINRSSVLSDAAIAAVIQALQLQVSNDFAPCYGRDALLTFVGHGQTPDPRAWWLVILDNSDQAGALGYHDLTPAGLPIGKVFAKTDLKYGTSWTNTTSHELLEMLADPWISLCAQVGRKFYAWEVCDPVEDDSLGYSINGVLVSDFILPAWYEAKSSGAFDFKRHLSKPLEILKGGYMSVFDVARGSWTQLNGPAARLDTSDRAPIGSRRERRALDAERWRYSDVTKEI